MVPMTRSQWAFVRGARGALLMMRRSSAWKTASNVWLQHEQLGVLHHLAAQQHRRHGQQLPGDLVQQGHDHPDMLSSGR
jgi:hypothetical protein